MNGIALNEALKKSAQADAAYYLGWTYLEDQKLATQADFDAIIENTQNPDAPQLPQKKWYHDGVAYCLENGLMQGDENGMFRPMDNITWAELLQILFNKEDTVDERIEHLPGKWYNKAVTWAKSKELICEEELQFNPTEPMTRQQMITVLYRYAQYRGMDVSIGESTDLSSCDDVIEISEHAMAAMQYAVGAGVLKGKTASTVNPLDNLTRAEIAVVLQRFLQNTAE